MFTPEPISAVLGGVALLLTALGGLAFRRGASEAKKPDPLDAVVKALEANTAAINAQSAHFASNNSMFGGMLNHAGHMRETLNDIDRTAQEAVRLAQIIQTEMVRRSR